MKNKIKLILSCLIFTMLNLTLLGSEAYRMLIDHNGFQVRIPKNPQRIIALQPSFIENLFEIGLNPVAKVDDYQIRREGITLPSVGSSENINIESIYALKPDVIIASSRHHGNILNLLRETGAAVYALDPSKLGDNPFLDSPRIFGEIFGMEKEAKIFMENLDLVALELEKKVQDKKKIESGIIIRPSKNIMAAQRASGYGTMLSVLGIENIVSDNLIGSNRGTFVSLSIEEIIINDPDIILITAQGNNKEQNQRILESFINDPLWRNLKAVKNNNVKILPFSVHPGRSKKDDMMRITAETILSN